MAHASSFRLWSSGPASSTRSRHCRALLFVVAAVAHANAAGAAILHDSCLNASPSLGGLFRNDGARGDETTGGMKTNRGARGRVSSRVRVMGGSPGTGRSSDEQPFGARKLDAQTTPLHCPPGSTVL